MCYWFNIILLLANMSRKYVVKAINVPLISFATN